MVAEALADRTLAAIRGRQTLGQVCLILGKAGGLWGMCACLLRLMVPFFVLFSKMELESQWPLLPLSFMFGFLPTNGC